MRSTRWQIHRWLALWLGLASCAVAAGAAPPPAQTPATSPRPSPVEINEFNRLVGVSARARAEGRFPEAVTAQQAALKQLGAMAGDEALRLRLTYALVTGRAVDPLTDPWQEDWAVPGAEQTQAFDRQWESLSKPATQVPPKIRAPTSDEMERIADAQRRLQMVPLFMSPARVLPLLDDAIKIARTTYGKDHPDTALLELKAAILKLSTRDRQAGKEEGLNTLRMLERTLGARSDLVKPWKIRLAFNLTDSGFFSDSLRLFDELIASGQLDERDTASAYSNQALNYHQLGLVEEALAARRAALLHADRAYPAEDRHRLYYMIDYSSELGVVGEYDEMVRWQRELLPALIEARAHPEAIAIALHNLSVALTAANGSAAEAVDAVERALALYSALGMQDSRSFAQSQDQLGWALHLAGRSTEAVQYALGVVQAAKETNDEEQLLTYYTRLGQIYAATGRATEARQAYADAIRYGDAQPGENPYPDAILARRLLAQNLIEAGDSARAATHLRQALRLTAQQLASVRKSRLEPRQREEVAATAFTLVRALWSAPGGRTRAELDEAFLAAQQASYSAAAEALNLRFAMASAGQVAVDHERVVAELALLARRATELAGKLDPASVEARREIGERAAALERQRAALAAHLEHDHPRYWSMRSPEPVSTATLKSGRGSRAAPLLRANEALIYWLVKPGAERGFVFAISRSRTAFAELPLSGTELAALVGRLRQGIDPCSQGASEPDCDRRGQTFDRSAAWKLYTALLGQKSIREVVASDDIRTLLIVPTGPLASLPPGLLIVSEPTGGSDRSAETLRDQTDWLIDHKAIAILPSVSTLLTLRQPGSSKKQWTTPLFMMAAPDFAGGKPPSGPCLQPNLARSPATARFDPAERRSAGAALCPLPGTEAEATALKTALGGIVLMGPEAREAKLREPGLSVLLREAEVVAFATHGLVAGQLGISEPALALASPRASESGDDGLLTASEASALLLTADWVLLSACNTASPAGPDDEALSGLARAFFYAGSKGVLASHWRVDDGATRALTSFTIALHKAGLDKAEALRQASCAVRNGALDTPPDPHTNYCASTAARSGDEANQRFANPAAWAPFVFVGSP